MSSGAEVVQALRLAGLSIATAESLTGGLLCAALTDVPGASAVDRGGVVSYATDRTAQVLGRVAHRHARPGAVHADVARQMAVGVCRVLGADVGVATTGVAGPDPQDGQPVGTVFVAAARGGDVAVRRLALTGDRLGIRREAVAAALDLVVAVVRGAEDSPPRGR